MSELTDSRDHARKMAAGGHQIACEAIRGRGWRAVVVRPDPACEGCLSPAEAALWTQIADEIDSYLQPIDETSLFD